MPDREKVIKGLEFCIKNIDRECPNDCPYHEMCAKYEGSFVFQPVLRDAYKLLKEQKAVKPQQEPILLENQHKPYGISTNANSPWISRCPKCGKKVEGKQTRFCKYCGQAVKWD